MLGTFALSAGYADQYYNQALKVRRLIRNDFDAAFRDVDVLLGPTSPTAAFRLGERTADPLAMYLSDIYTITANLAGIPGLSIPCGLTRSGLPIGLQLLGPGLRRGEPAPDRPRLRAGHRLAHAAAGSAIMAGDKDFTKLGACAADLDAAWQDRLADAEALLAADRPASAIAMAIYALEICLKVRICKRLDLPHSRRRSRSTTSMACSCSTGLIERLERSRAIDIASRRTGTGSVTIRSQVERLRYLPDRDWSQRRADEFLDWLDEPARRSLAMAVEADAEAERFDGSLERSAVCRRLRAGIARTIRS